MNIYKDENARFSVSNLAETETSILSPEEITMRPSWEMIRDSTIPTPILFHSV